MANNYMMDDLDEDQILDNASDPYDSVSDRAPLGTEDLDMNPSPVPQGTSANPAIKEAIMKRSMAKLPPKEEDLGSDPFMKQFEENQDKLNSYRDTKRGADLISNLGQSFSQLAQGTNAPRANTGLYDNIQKQNEGLLRSNEDDVDRRNKVIQAIEARKSRESIAADNRKTREAIAQGSRANKEAAQDLAINRTMGQVVGRINQDPIIKPSETNLASLQKSRSILDNDKVPLTPQSLSDAEQDIASALTLRSMGATEGKIKRTEIETLGRKIAEFKQKWGGNPAIDLRKEQPELVTQIKKLNDSLIDDYHTTIKDRKNSVLDEYQAVYGDNRQFQDRIGKLRDNFNKSSPAPSGGSGLFMNSAMADSGGKQEVRKQYSPSRNQTKITYSDGTSEIVDGKP